MAEFSLSYPKVKKFEYGYVNIANDNGGETYHGCARNFFGNWKGWDIIDKAKSHSSFKQGTKAFTAYLDSLPELQKLLDQWYKQEWWDSLKLDALPQVVADELFEQTVNLGKSGATKNLQRVCNAFNYNTATKKTYFTDLVVDGVMGSKTLQAILILLKEKVSADVFVLALNCLQGAHYINLASTKMSQRLFTTGWLKRAK